MNGLIKNWENKKIEGAYCAKLVSQRKLATITPTPQFRRFLFSKKSGIFCGDQTCLAYQYMGGVSHSRFPKMQSKQRSICRRKRRGYSKHSVQNFEMRRGTLICCRRIARSRTQSGQTNLSFASNRARAVLPKPKARSHPANQAAALYLARSILSSSFIV
jgi:hypothetical protein